MILLTPEQVEWYAKHDPKKLKNKYVKTIYGMIGIIRGVNENGLLVEPIYQEVPKNTRTLRCN